MKTIYPSEFPLHVSKLREFLTHNEIEQATHRLRQAEKTADIVEHQRLREDQPWLYAFDLYRKLTMNGQRVPKSFPPEIHSLVVGGIAAKNITARMSEALRKHHRAALLSLEGNFAPFFAEWTAANFYANQLSGEINWQEASQRSGDFIVETPTLSFEVECKRYGSMIAELFGDKEARGLASALLALLQSERVHGVLDIHVKTHPDVAYDDALRLLRTALVGSQRPAQISIYTAAMDIVGTLHPSTEAGDPITGFAELRNPPADARNVAAASKIQGRPSNLRFLRIRGPRRSPDELVHYLAEKMDWAACEQLSGKLGGVLIVEFARVSDPEAFRDSEGMQTVLYRLFVDHKHLAAVVLRAAPFAIDSAGSTHAQQFAYSARSNVSDFPGVAALAHIGVDG